MLKTDHLKYNGTDTANATEAAQTAEEIKGATVITPATLRTLPTGLISLAAEAFLIELCRRAKASGDEEAEFNLRALEMNLRGRPKHKLPTDPT